jgi:hypothetical protein
MRNKVNKPIRETKSTFYINKISECADTKDLKKMLLCNKFSARETK